MYPIRLVHDLRPTMPWSIYELPIDIPGSEPRVHSRRFAVKWDEDYDERVLGAVLDAYYRYPESIWTLYAIGERKASLTVWTAELTPERQHAWREAARSPAIMDAWDLEFVDSYDEVARTGGMKALRQSAQGDRPRHFTPEHDELNALIDLFKLGPAGPRREFSWT